VAKHLQPLRLRVVADVIGSWLMQSSHVWLVAGPMVTPERNSSCPKSWGAARFTLVVEQAAGTGGHFRLTCHRGSQLRRGYSVNSLQTSLLQDARRDKDVREGVGSRSGNSSENMSIHGVQISVATRAHLVKAGELRMFGGGEKRSTGSSDGRVDYRCGIREEAEGGRNP